MEAWGQRQRGKMQLQAMRFYLQLGILRRWQVEHQRRWCCLRRRETDRRELRKRWETTIVRIVFKRGNTLKPVGRCVMGAFASVEGVVPSSSLCSTTLGDRWVELAGEYSPTARWLSIFSKISTVLRSWGSSKAVVEVFADIFFCSLLVEYGMRN